MNKIMKKSFSFLSVLLFAAVAVTSAPYPPDYDFDHEYLDAPPTDLSAGWAR